MFPANSFLRSVRSICPHYFLCVHKCIMLSSARWLLHFLLSKKDELLQGSSKFVNRECHSITLTRFSWIFSTLHKYNAKVVSYSKVAIVFSNVTLTQALELTCNNCVVRKISPLLDSTDQCTISLTRSTLEQNKDLKVG